MERLLPTGYSRYQMIFMGLSLQLLTIYKQNLRSFICLLNLCLSTKHKSHTKKRLSRFLMLLFWDFMKHFLVLLVINRMVSTTFQPVIPSIRKLLPFLQKHKFQWRTFANGKIKSLEVVTNRIGWRLTFQNNFHGSSKIYFDRRWLVMLIYKQGEATRKLHQTIQNASKGINIMSTAIGGMRQDLQNMRK